MLHAFGVSPTLLAQYDVHVPSSSAGPRVARVSFVSRGTMSARSQATHCTPNAAHSRTRTRVPALSSSRTSEAPLRSALAVGTAERLSSPHCLVVSLPGAKCTISFFGRVAALALFTYSGLLPSFISAPLLRLCLRSSPFLPASPTSAPAAFSAATFDLQLVEPSGFSASSYFPFPSRPSPSFLSRSPSFLPRSRPPRPILALRGPSAVLSPVPLPFALCALQLRIGSSVLILSCDSYGILKALRPYFFRVDEDADDLFQHVVPARHVVPAVPIRAARARDRAAEAESEVEAEAAAEGDGGYEMCARCVPSLSHFSPVLFLSFDGHQYICRFVRRRLASYRSCVGLAASPLPCAGAGSAFGIVPYRGCTSLMTMRDLP
ncbi:hypothetical protein B0H13DRAFT_2374632 [Mycena leptocephala]|nr:hypothetical protein B0H13DRAFT_2374632 [Mycena leptocephala]